MKKTLIFIFLIVFMDSCTGPKTCIYHLSFTNKSNDTIEFSWFYRRTKEGKIVKIKKGKSIDFDQWTDENPQRSFPQSGDSIVVVLSNGKKIIEVKQCEALGSGTSTCTPDERSLFNPKAYIAYKNGWLNKSCGGKEYIFTNEDAQRAK